jgi:hypothetical protein
MIIFVKDAYLGSNKESLSNTVWKARNHLALTHSYLCGPVETLSFGKERYFLTFIDDYSKKTLIYFLQENSDTFV